MKKFIIISLSILHLFAQAKPELSKNIIQIGVFKDAKNIAKLKQDLKDYDFFTKTYPNKLKKLFIVNIKDKELEKTLSDIKKIVPKAFVLKEKQKKMLFLQKQKSDWLNKSLSKNEQKSKLDSKAIIKTRNKFFE